MSNTLALAVGPAAATGLMGILPLPTLFVVSAAVASTAVLMAALLNEGGRRGTGLASARGDLISRPALFPSAVVACLTVTYGVVFVFVPLLAKERGIDPTGVGLFFTVFAILLLVGRAASGAVSDRWGRAAAIVPGMLLAALAMVLLALSGSLPLLLAAGAAYGLAFAAVHPALMALVVDRVPPSGRGSAMATFTAAFDLGIGLGALIWGAILAYLGYTGVFASLAVVALVGLVAFLAGNRKPRPVEEPPVSRP
jgi:predicted MFS family arabinose efflux permease